MSFEIGTATGHTDLLDKLNTFLTAKGSAFGLSYTGTGDGAFTAYRGGASSVAETFTITATSATSFDVVGSVTGSIGPATVGAPFAHATIEFTISAGGVAFVAGDEFKINTAPKWVAERAVAGSEYIWRAPGNDGTSEIYSGALAFSNVGADYYNLRLGGFIGYDSGLSFTAQPGAMTRVILPLRNASIPYWFVASGRSVRVVALVSTVYEPAYLGFLEAFASPGEWAYPLMIGGAMAFASEPIATSTSWRWSNTTDEHRAYPTPFTADTMIDNAAQLRIRLPDGTWKGFGVISGGTIRDANARVWPYHAPMSDWRANLDGSYPRFPIMPFSVSPSTNVWGRFEGVFCFPGFAVSAETEIIIGRERYIAFPNIYRSSSRDFFALQLD